MSKHRLAPRFAALLLLLVPCARVAADESAHSDPWPLPQAAPQQGADAARATLDALDARRAALTRARLAPMMDAIVRTEPEESHVPSYGRMAVSPAQSMRGLQQAARTSQEADSRTVPEIMKVLSATAFDGGIVLPDVHVIPGPDGKIDRVFKAELTPHSIDDRPYVLRPNLLLRPAAVPPPPPPRTVAEPSGQRVVKGVRIEVDEALLRRAFEAPGAPEEGPELAALEARLLSATDGEGVVQLLDDFGRAKKQALLASRLSGDSAPLTRVSLRSLLDEAGAAADSRRTCGALTRIVGVAVAEASSGADDVTLLGLVEPGAPAISLEALSLALKYVWREGRVPGCSLDPDPKNPAGPQRVRIFGIAPDSTFARTMLDADYEMKKIIGAAPGAQVIEGLVNLPSALSQTSLPSDASINNRYWLTPTTPGPGDVLFSPDRAAALFDARVSVRTEEMREDFAVGSGRASSASALVARSFTERYADIARALPVFSELHGLFDAVYTAQVLRFLAPSHPLLERAADRPHVVVSVPESYPGIRVAHRLSDRLVVVEGGCEASARLASGALLDVQHPAFDALKLAVSVTPPVPRVLTRGRAQATEELLLAAQAALGEKRYDEAEDLATEALDADPNDLAALALRAVARVRAGHSLAGVQDALEATRRAPHEPLYEANLRALLAELGDSEAFVGLSAPGAEVLHATYLAEAAAAGLRQEWMEAATAATRALRVNPGSEPARVLQATLMWLVGDLVVARRLADEAAILFPRSVDAQALSGWVAAMQGDHTAARAAFDRSIALRPAADTLGSRAVLRLLANDLAGAGNDAHEALRMDPTDWGTQLALQALRRAACWGLEKAQREIAAQLRLPPAAQLAAFEAQQALALDQTGIAARAYERMLAAFAAELETGRLSQTVLSESHGREIASLMLARCLGTGGPQDSSTRERVEELLGEVERAHPTWLGPRWTRVLIAQKVGDNPAALAALATCRGGDPSQDPFLIQFAPSRECFAALVSILECSLPLTAPGGPEAIDRQALDRLDAVYRGGPSAPLAEALTGFLRHVLEGESSPAAQRALERFRTVADQVAAEAVAPLAPEDILLRVALLGGRSAELALENDSDGALARAVRRLATLSPMPDIYESVTSMVAEQRKRAMFAAIARFVQDVEKDPRGRIAMRVAETDLEPARRMIQDVIRPARDRAATLGEPLLEYLVDIVLMGMVDGIEVHALDTRLVRVRRVLEVALDPVKINRLRATEAEIVARKREVESALEVRARERAAALRSQLASPTDAKTLGLLQREMAASAARRGESAEVDPLDLRRQTELNLKASLDALGAPLPAGLK